MKQSKHPKAQYFISKGLFSELKNFNEFETRMASLTDHERGQAFEVFAEAYFATCAIFQAEEVWPDKVIPQSIRNLLGLPPIDMGIDGVFKTLDGNYHAYQIKYRTGRTTLSWDELSTFMGLSDKAHMRLLLTNAQDIAAVMNSRTDFYSVKGNDLDRLDESDFKKIEEWLRLGIVVHEKKLPFPHQIEAINDIASELSSNGRATAIMACGTGKTLVALWVAEKIEAKTILVLLPSLSLVRQTLHDWAKENSWNNFNYLCVCSDASVVKGDDEIILRQEDLDFPVTTQKEVVVKFLQNSRLNPKVIFSTYQSSSIVAQAMPAGFAFDIAIFDEAHKTASRQGTNYSFALQDKNIAIKKRLFLTATPRHYNVNQKDKDGENKIVFSMDDQAVYGKLAHQLSFRSAVKKDLICDYKVIISVVTSDMITREALKHGEVIVEGDVVKAQRMANIIALQKAVEKHNIRRIFSFHSSVAAAKSFTSHGAEGVGGHLEGFVALHVNGEMHTSKREIILKEFEESSKALISNARCLTEGVNVPVVDMVAFVSPKKSKVDIVQAAGRAMRKHKNKQIGYILIPLFVQVAADEQIEESLKKTQFDAIWDVLQAMQEQDESLVEIIAQLREDRGKALGCNDNRLRERIEILGPELSLAELRKVITAQIINQLGSSWDERFGELIMYKESYGHCNVPRNYKENQGLAVWVGVQRNLNNSKSPRLTQKRKDKLNQIGFEWDPIGAQWNKMLLKLKEFQSIHGTCNIPIRDALHFQLVNWIGGQRKAYKKNKLSNYQIEQLASIGFTFDVLSEQWDNLYDDLARFKEKNGHCNVPRDFAESLKLSTWVAQQRKARKRKKITDERINKLDELGFCWNPLDEYQEKMLLELKKFKERNGHCNVPQQYEESSLGQWIIAQRIRYHKRKLTHELIARLNELSFDWDPRATIWNVLYQEMCDFKNKHGHCIVRHNDENQRLAQWVKQQRILYANCFQPRNRNGRLSEDRYEKLNSIGFIWNTFEARWEEMYLELSSFKEQTGHCDIPGNHENYTLFRWTGTQRDLFKKRQLDVERINRLNLLDFRWQDLKDELWNRKFLELCKFKSEYGHCNVPLRYDKNSSLGSWVVAQRGLYKKNKLSKEKIQQLMEIGFIFDLLNEAWEIQFSALCAYNSINGHCNVPANDPTNISLSSWVRRQRSDYKLQKITSTQILRLNQIGFVWNRTNRVS